MRELVTAGHLHPALDVTRVTSGLQVVSSDIDDSGDDLEQPEKALRAPAAPSPIPADKGGLQQRTKESLLVQVCVSLQMGQSTM